MKISQPKATLCYILLILVMLALGSIFGFSEELAAIGGFAVGIITMCVLIMTGEIDND